MRLFVAVETEPADAAGATAPQHLTLRFLGEVTPEQAARLPTLLRPVGASVPPFEIRLEGVGAFPSAERPRVVWVGVTTGREALETLASRVRDALAPEFGAEPGPFVGHLTLFRVRRPADRRAAEELLAGKRPAPPPRSVRVDRFVLKESVLGRTGAVHRTVEEFPLQGKETGST